MCFGGATSSEYAAQQQSATEATALQNDFTQQFSEQQGLLNGFIIPQLQAMISNPVGFGPVTLAALNSSLVNNVASQTANLKQAQQQAFGSNNMAGLPSGVNAVAQSQIASQAANSVEQGSANIGVANAQLQNQQRQFAQGQLLQAENQLGAAPQTGSLMLNANNQNFQQDNIIQQQNAAANPMNAILGGVVGAGMSFLTGGLSNLTSGLSFLGNSTGGAGGGGGGGAGAGVGGGAVGAGFGGSYA
jgi:hypothetical protein